MVAVVVVAVEILRSGVVAGGAMEEEEEEEGDDVATRRVDKNDEDEDDDAEKKLLLPCLHDDSIGNSSPYYRQDMCLPPSGCKVTWKPTNDMPAAWVHDHVDSGT